MTKIRPIFIISLLFLMACETNESNNTSESANDAAISPPVNIPYTIVNVFPHDTGSYTQGLIWHNNQLYEGTGLKEKSQLRIVNLANGKAVKQLSLPKEYFGEGITLFQGKIYQLTWEEHKVFVYDAVTFKKIKEYNWTYEGWGLTNNGQQLIVTTGGSNLYFVNPETFAIERTISITDNNGYLAGVNELEFVNGFIYGNVYGENYIVRINPQTGIVEGKVDLSDLLQKTGATYNPTSIDPGYVLNGIAYDSTKKSFYITGKNWPSLYEVKWNNP